MTCCKSTSTGVGIPTTAPTNNDPDIYIEQPSGQIWVWNGTKWTKPPVGSVSYNSTTRVLTVGSSSVTLPIASSTEYGVVKLANSTTDPTNPIEANPDGTLTINCTKLIAHCGLATETYVDGKISDTKNYVDATIAGIPSLTGSQIVNLLTSMSREDLAGLACKIVSTDTGNLIQCRPNGIYYGIEAPAEIRNQYVDAANGDDNNAGTRDAPLRTIKRAIDRLPSNTAGNAIHLHEDSVHIWYSSWNRTADVGITFYTYGENTDNAKILWAAKGVPDWAWHGWEYSPRATISFVADATWFADNSKKYGQCVQGNSYTHIIFYGIRLINGGSTGTLQTEYSHWNAVFVGSGSYFEYTDCILEGFTAQRPLNSTDGPWNYTITMRSSRLVNSSTWLWLLPIGSGVATLSSAERVNSGSTPGGLLWFTSSTVQEIYDKVANKQPVKQVHSNLYMSPLP